MTLAPAAAAASTVKLSKVTISILVPVALAIGAVSVLRRSIFSATEKSGVLPGCTPTPTTRVSTRRAARSITSRCPLVTGSKEPEVKPTRFIAVSPRLTLSPLQIRPRPCARRGRPCGSDLAQSTARAAKLKKASWPPHARQDGAPEQQEHAGGTIEPAQPRHIKARAGAGKDQRVAHIHRCQHHDE